MTTMTKQAKQADVASSLTHFVERWEGRKKPKLEYRYRVTLPGEFKDDMGRPIKRAVDFDIQHRDGGLNVWHGTQEQRGVELNIMPKELGDGYVGYTIDWGTDMRVSGTRVLVLPLPRRSDKQLTRVAALLDPEMPELGRLWLEDIAGARRRLLDLMQRVPNSIGVK